MERMTAGMEVTKEILVLRKHVLTSNSHAKGPDTVFLNLGFVTVITTVLTTQMKMGVHQSLAPRHSSNAEILSSVYTSRTSVMEYLIVTMEVTSWAVLLLLQTSATVRVSSSARPVGSVYLKAGTVTGPRTARTRAMNLSRVAS